MLRLFVGGTLIDMLSFPEVCCDGTKELEYLRQVEDHASRTGWVSPLTREDKEYFSFLRQVSKRYNIDMSKANRLEYNFVIRVAESEFYAHHTS